MEYALRREDGVRNRDAHVDRHTVCLGVVIAGLVISGVTAFPLREELTLGSQVLHAVDAASWLPGLAGWVDRVADALVVTGEQYPFLAYGTDWLAFAHLLIAVAFIGPLRDPVRNVWVTQWGLIACAGIVPLALIAGTVRGLPLGWQLIDITFGVVAAIPLTVALILTNRLERQRSAVARTVPGVAAAPETPVHSDPARAAKNDSVEIESPPAPGT